MRVYACTHIKKSLANSAGVASRAFQVPQVSIRISSTHSGTWFRIFVTYICIYVRLKDLKRSMSEKIDQNELWL
jgi:hypothetical protein